MILLPSQSVGALTYSVYAAALYPSLATSSLTNSPSALS